MSAKNGDKARYGRMRKQKLARRLRTVELKKAISTSTNAEPTAK